MQLFSLLIASILLADIPFGVCAAASPPTSPSSPRPQIRELLGNTTFIENLHVRPNGQLLLSSVSTNSLYTLNPKAAIPAPVIVANLPNVTGLTGIATLDESAGLFAVSGGIHFSMGFVNGSCAVYVVSLPGNSKTGKVVDRISVDGILNGMVSLPAYPHIVLSADSVGGQIFRVNTRTRRVDVPISNPALLGGGGNPSLPIGVNGLKIFGSYVYFTNSGLGTFGRVKIDRKGNKIGKIEILARSAQDGGVVSRRNAWDDFDFDISGNAYVALHAYSFVKITPKLKQSTFYGGVGEYTTLWEPTAAAVSKKNPHLLYLATGGITINGTKHGGQLFEAKI